MGDYCIDFNSAFKEDEVEKSIKGLLSLFLLLQELDELAGSRAPNGLMLIGSFAVRPCRWRPADCTL